VEKLNKLKLEKLKEVALHILEKQITDLKDQIVLINSSGMDKIARLYSELMRSEIMQMARDREATHIACAMLAEFRLLSY
jgi:hypothetical protein